ncbi:DUF2066 domain-containing protein [Anderseniella sp. Alg231-50]|uniref:DUF2066 domain-containing protein n=1 Tax=Anderseniella sp. Alg231-50 TaxID=1922226 RepID=UPI000D558CEE
MKSFIHDVLNRCDSSRATIAADGPANLTGRLKRTCRQTAAAMRFAVVCALLIGFASLVAASPSFARENPLYTITGVEVDVRAETAAEAKKQAITEANVKAFALFAQRVGGNALAGKLSGIPSKRIDAMLDSLSIEEERTGPQRYIGKLTVRFLPGEMRKIMAELGVSYSEKLAGRTVIIPVWRTPESLMLWEDNPWRTAWLSLRAENSPVPLIVPLGDLADTDTLTAELAAGRDEASLEAIRLRYEADTILVAEASAVGEDTVQATMVGASAVGRLEFDKAYVAENGGGIAEAARIAALRFHQVMLLRWKKKNETGPVTQSLPVATLPIAVAFYSTEEWSALRARILSTPGVSGVDISTISQGGAIVQLSYVTGFEQLRQSLWSAGLALQNVGGTWVLQAS